jgi:hypothetical protein
MANLTDDEIKEVVCLHCQAEPLQPCIENGMQLIGFHQARIDLRSKMPVYDCPLDPTDKAIIIGYAFVMLCNSVAANSEKLFSKKYDSQEIQRMFSKSGMDAAIADGFIGPEKMPKDAAKLLHGPIQSTIIDPLCGECNRPKSHILHDKDLGGSRYHEFVEAEHISNRHERRSPDYKRKIQ